MAKKAPSTPKLCERCEAFFPSIASATCPQCFAPLETLTEEEAVRAAEFQLERLHDPDHVQRKYEDDEKFKEQSFGACLGVLGIVILVAALSLMLIGFAKYTRKQPSSTVATAKTHSTLRPLPFVLAGLPIGAVTNISPEGTSFPIEHTNYGGQVQVFFLPNGAATAQSLSTFDVVISAVTHQTNPPMVAQPVHLKSGYYEIIGSNGGLVGQAAQSLVNSVSASDN